MSQALHTASTGINSGQSQINVIANNVANINTTAYKAANLTFETLFSRNLSYGSSATKSGGGTNPKQIGLGVKVGGITRNFVTGEYVSTGRDMDTMISGNGFYVVQDGDGKQYFTRDGIFSLDSAGNLVTQSGMKVVATKSTYSNSSSGQIVNIPKNLKAEVIGDPAIETKKISELNNASITSGTISATINGYADAAKTIPVSKTVTLTVADGDPTIGKIISDFNQAIKDAQFVNNNDPNNPTTTQVFWTDVSFSAGNGVITVADGDNISYNEDGTTSNFIAQTGLARSSTSEVISQTVKLQDVLNYNDSNALSLQSTTIDENGIVIASYTNGSILTQYVDGSGSLQWKYTTPEGVIITGSDVQAIGASLTNSNFAIELATMVNQEGLVSVTSNLWEWGPNAGEVFYGMAGEMALGTIETGGYEGSNVDIASELTNMITAQRMIQMNSRVFSTASTIMETLAYLGQ